jgi:hypothetical protein
VVTKGVHFAAGEHETAVPPNVQKAPSRRAFLFPHGRKPNRRAKGLPGRVPFEVHAALVSKDGVAHGNAIVMGDGYGPNEVGPNQDPCILAPAPLHSFCRINRSSFDNYIRGTSALLSQRARPGDLIVYGSLVSPRKDPLSHVLVDLVLVVDRVVTWPLIARARGVVRRDGCAKRGRWLHASPRDFANQLFESGHSAYVFNLADAEATGTHCCTSLACYHVIVGRAEATAQALLGLQTSFLPPGARRKRWCRLPSRHRTRRTRP